MFKRQRQFNIITGQVSNGFHTQRTQSCAQQLLNYKKISSINLKPLKLGMTKDKKQFKYSYISEFKPSLIIIEQDVNKLRNSQSSVNSSMMNCVSTRYNILNHTNQLETVRVANKEIFSHKMPGVFKKSILTEHLHKARLLAPNYHQNYEKRFMEHQFNRKPGFCAGICQIQKTYGQAKYFRKLK